MDLLFQRHDLVWLSAQGWEQIRPQIPLAWHSESLRWQYGDWPLVVTRRDHHLPSEQLNLGLVFLQPDGSTQACRVAVSSHHITGHQPCLALHSILSHVLPEWQPGLQALHQAGREAGITVRVYGLAAWQFLTGLSYLQPDTEIRLLFRPQDQEHLVSGLTILRHFSSSLPLRGEIVFPGGAAVSWREWLISDTVAESLHSQKILMKAFRQQKLVSRYSLLQLLKSAQ